MDKAERWLERCAASIPAFGEPSLLHKPFPGFRAVFRTRLLTSPHWRHALDSQNRDNLKFALDDPDPRQRFERVLQLYTNGLRQLADVAGVRADVVMVCLPPEVIPH